MHTVQSCILSAEARDQHEPSCNFSRSAHTWRNRLKTKHSYYLRRKTAWSVYTVHIHSGICGTFPTVFSDKVSAAICPTRMKFPMFLIALTNSCYSLQSLTFATGTCNPQTVPSHSPLVLYSAKQSRSMHVSNNVLIRFVLSCSTSSVPFGSHSQP